MNDWSRRQVVRRCGYAAPAIAIGGMLFAMVLASPDTFAWRTRALSDMGRAGTRSFWAFNGGLTFGGLVGLPFVWYLWQTTRNRIERLATVLTGVAVVGMIGVGIFFIGHTDYYLATDRHALAAVTVFGVAPVAQLVAGTGQVLAGDRWIAIASFWLAVAHFVGWLGWLAYRAGASDPSHWFAVPEFVAAVAFGGWIALLAYSLE